MKKLLIVMNAVMLSGLLFFCSCEEENEQGESELAEKTTVDNAANCYNAATGGTTFNGLNAMLVYALAKNYKNNQLQAINNAHPGLNDARSVWFELETLKRFIFEIESQTCGKCDNDPSKMLGVRIYYGAYPDSAAWGSAEWSAALEGVPVTNAGKHTVMLVPTYHDNTTNAEIDFDPNYITTGCNFSHIDNFYAKMATNPPSSITLAILSTLNGTAQNHGEMIPPPYNANGILNRGAGIMYAVDQY